jgi:hypothetical protein
LPILDIVNPAVQKQFNSSRFSFLKPLFFSMCFSDLCSRIENSYALLLLLT